jgi:hypothetical protein
MGFHVLLRASFLWRNVLPSASTQCTGNQVFDVSSPIVVIVIAPLPVSSGVLHWGAGTVHPIICARTGSQTLGSKTRTPSSTPHAPPSESSWLNPKRSPPSECATGLTEVGRCDLGKTIIRIETLIAGGPARWTKGVGQGREHNGARHDRPPSSSEWGFTRRRRSPKLQKAAPPHE